MLLVLHAFLVHFIDVNNLVSCCSDTVKGTTYYSTSFLCILFIRHCSDISYNSSGKSSFLEDGEANEERLLDMQETERNAGRDSSSGGGGGGCEEEGRVVIRGQR